MAFSPAGFISVPPGARRGFDHADIYFPHPGAARLYVAHTAADRIDVFDCAAKTYIGEIPDAPGVAGVLVANERGLILASDRGAARISFYNAVDETLCGRVKVDPRPNALAYDPTRRQAYSFNLGNPIGSGCTASVIAIDEWAVVSTIPLPGRPRWAVYDAATDRVYANIQEPAQVVAIEAGAGRIESTYDVPSAGPHGLAMIGDRLFCATDAGHLIVLERDSGTVLGSIELSGEPDVIMTDAETGRLFVAIGLPGVIDVIDQHRMTRTETIPTEDGTHTIAWNPYARTLYAFLPRRCGALMFEES